MPEQVEAIDVKAQGQAELYSKLRLGPYLFALSAIAVPEIWIVDVLLRLWSDTVATTITALSCLAMAISLTISTSLYRMPSSIDERRVDLRLGLWLYTTFAWDEVASIELHPDRDDCFGSSVANGFLLDEPNILIRFKTETEVRFLSLLRKRYIAVALTLDEPEILISLAPEHLVARDVQ